MAKLHEVRFRIVKVDRHGTWCEAHSKGRKTPVLLLYTGERDAAPSAEVGSWFRVKMGRIVPALVVVLASAVAVDQMQQAVADGGKRAVKARGKGAALQEKVRHVSRAKQTRAHKCHWPDCTEEVAPARWGCRAHWFMLPKVLRQRLWEAYNPGQEDGTAPVSAAYVEAAAAIQAWIAARPAVTR